MVNRKVVVQRQFRKDVRKLKKQGKDLQKLSVVMQMIEERKKLPPKHKNHHFLGAHNIWDCHIEGDWILLYKLVENEVIFIRTGSHSEVLGM